MGLEDRHITRKVAAGYLLLLILAVCSAGYIYKVVEEVAGSRETDPSARRKTYLVTNTLSLLYESEALGQLIGMPENDFKHFNRTLDKAHRNMDSLRLLVHDSLQQLKIDTIDVLLERKRWNTKRLLETWNESNAERLYAENIEKVIAVQDTVPEQVEVRQQVEIREDTVVVPRPKRGFFRRLADVFAPEKLDTNIVVNSTRQVLTDTLVNVYNPSDTIVSVLKSIRDSVAGERSRLRDLLTERAANLRYNNTVVSRQINQLLRSIEEEEMEASLAEVQKKQALLRRTSYLIGGIGAVSAGIALLFMALIGRDVSRSRFYRLQLEKAKLYAEGLLRGREKLILTISHDIRAPLSSVIGYIELLLRRHPDERQRYFLENMKASSDHILSLVNDLLDYQRLEAGEMEIHRVPFRLGVLLDEIYTSFQPLAQAKGLAFVWNNEGDFDGGIRVSGDPMRIRQVIGNLLSNAIKFTFEGNIVLGAGLEAMPDGAALSGATGGSATSTVSTGPAFPAAEGEQRVCLRVSVRDSGPGIAPDEQEKIFGEFTRLSAAEEVEGFGLGLSITRKLIALMGGELSLASAPGEGSVFSFSLPLGKVAAEADAACLPATETETEAEGDGIAVTPGEADTAIEASAGAGAPIETEPAVGTYASEEGAPRGSVYCLLVDDDPLQLALTEELLKQSRVQVVGCTNPYKVTEWLEKQWFDAVMTDIQMPGLDGYRVLEKIRLSGLPGTSDIPVIALSASLAEERAHYVEAGFAGFLNKPFTAAQLISLLNSLSGLQLQAPSEADTVLNFSSLTAFAGEDEAASASILRTFAQETGKSIALLKQALAEADREAAARVSHKLIPLFTMLGANTLVQHLRILEKKDGGLTDSGWGRLLGEVIAKVSAVVEKALAG